MKKLILTSLLWIIWLIWFSSADYTFTSSWMGYEYIYTPERVTIWDDFDITNIKSFSCPYYECVFYMLLDGDSDYSCQVFYKDWEFSYPKNNCPAWNYYIRGVDESENAFDSITFWSSAGGWDIEWWQIIENWTDAFSPIITSVFSIMWEFIPYVVYVWIWVLLVSLWFVAVKWLMNWLTSKITKYFK